MVTYYKQALSIGESLLIDNTVQICFKRMKIVKRVLAISVLIFCSTIVTVLATVKKEVKPLYKAFITPPMEYRPMVRWWWNGNKITAKEILRELDLLQEAGIGGVEINPIAFNGAGDDRGIPSLKWLSPEWIELVKVATEGCRERGMTSDIIIGSGWPFGAEFVKRDHQIQMMTVETIDIPAGTSFSIRKEEILSKVNPQILARYSDPRKELVFLRLMPQQIQKFTSGIPLDAMISCDSIKVNPQPEASVLYCFVKLQGYMMVIYGVPGGSGPVVNHFNPIAVKSFLEVMSQSMLPIFGRLGNSLRATFIDSFELEGANWDAHLLAEFEKRRGYSLYPYLPYLITKVGHYGIPLKEKYGSGWSTEVNSIVERVRSDYYLTQRELFKEGFIDTYTSWCRSNGVKSRVQAYGIGLHPLEASLDIDIPECETWVRNEAGSDFPDQNMLIGRPYSTINKFVASASYLSGKSIVSCEEATNTRHVFNTSLEKLKLIGDMSNLSGVNHSVYHGFNYSPPETTFPGWIRFGSYINENNTWWKYMRLWNDYKARVSTLLSNAELQADIAVLHPLEDLWSKYGPQLDPVPEVALPEWGYNLWEAIHQNGNGCDYVSEKIIAQSNVKDGRLCYNNRRYNTLILMEVESLQPNSAQALERFVTQGGKVICIGKTPRKSVGLLNADARDKEVKEIINRTLSRFPDRFVLTESPGGTPMHEWYAGLQRKFHLTPYIFFNEGNKFLSQNYYKAQGKDIFFIVNYNLNAGVRQSISFPGVNTDGKYPWLWNAETGERFRLPALENGKMELRMGRAESCFIVFDTLKQGIPYSRIASGQPETIRLRLDGSWEVDFLHHITKQKMHFFFSKLENLCELPILELSCFAGEIDYSQTVNVELPEALSVLDAGSVPNAITELFVNGHSVGLKWYGDLRFDIKDRLKKGENTITIRVTTTLGNYCKSLKNNQLCYDWTKRQDFQPMGLIGPVVCY